MQKGGGRGAPDLKLLMAAGSPRSRRLDSPRGGAERLVSDVHHHWGWRHAGVQIYDWAGSPRADVGKRTSTETRRELRGGWETSEIRTSRGRGAVRNSAGRKSPGAPSQFSRQVFPRAAREFRFAGTPGNPAGEGELPVPKTHLPKGNLPEPQGVGPTRVCKVYDCAGCADSGKRTSTENAFRI